MAEESEWSKRLGEAMAGTLQEQLRSLVHEAQEGLRTFAEAAIEQSGVLGDAHKRLIAAQHQFEAGVRELRVEVGKGFEELKGVTVKADEERRAADQALQTKFAAAINSLTERTRLAEEALRTRQLELEARLTDVLDRVADTSLLEERTAQRLFQMLARAFAELGRPAIDITDGQRVGSSAI